MMMMTIKKEEGRKRKGRRCEQGRGNLREEGQKEKK